MSSHTGVEYEGSKGGKSASHPSYSVLNLMCMEISLILFLPSPFRLFLNRLKRLALLNTE